MADELKPEEFSFSQTQEFNKTDGTNTAISELSKKGYQYLKDNSTKEAIEAFNQILNIEENNNYALVGLGDSFAHIENRKENGYSFSFPFAAFLRGFGLVSS